MLHSDDKHILKTFCHWYQHCHIQADFDWSLFTNTFYENGLTPSTSADDGALPSLPNASNLPDPSEFLQLDTSVVLAAWPPTVTHDYLFEIQALASSNCMKYNNLLPYGMDLQPYSEWQVHSSKHIILDLAGSNRLPSQHSIP